jgi:hypothetical protein
MFRILIQDGDLPWAVYEAGFDSASTAIARVQDLKPHFPDKKLRIEKAPDLSWREREAARAPHPIVGTRFWRLYGAHLDLYPHVSVVDPDKLAYTPSSEWGEQDRQKRCTLAAFLDAEFEHIYRGARRAVVAELSPARLVFVHDTDKIIDLYQRGPSSCMSQDEGDYPSCVHPVSVYGGASDISLAVLQAPDTILARALVWGEKKRFARIYAINSEVRARMESALADAGYEYGGFNGARLNRIADGYDFVLPYLDRTDTTCHPCAAGVNDNGDFLVWRDTGGDIMADGTNGLAGGRRTCENCGEHISEDEEIYSPVFESIFCEHCYHESHAACDYCGGDADSNAITRLYDGTVVCENCMETGEFRMCEETSEFYHIEDGAFTPRGEFYSYHGAELAELVLNDDGEYVQSERCTETLELFPAKEEREENVTG